MMEEGIVASACSVGYGGLAEALFKEILVIILKPMRLPRPILKRASARPP